MAASLTEEELAMLEALEARVTPTPWRAGNVDLDCIFVAATHADDHHLQRPERRRGAGE